MRTLHLLRHAKSSWKDAALDDHDRPLSKRGRRATRALADHLARSHVAPDLVLCSSALRARETLDLIAGALKPPKVMVEREFYEAGPRRLLRSLRELPESAQCVLLVGHNPALHELALALADTPSARRLPARDEKFPTAALASFRLAGAWSVLVPRSATLLAYVTPADIEGGG